MTHTTPASIHHLIADMADARRAYAAEHGMIVTDDEIADSIKRALVRMMADA